MTSLLRRLLQELRIERYIKLPIYYWLRGEHLFNDILSMWVDPPPPTHPEIRPKSDLSQYKSVFFLCRSASLVSYAPRGLGIRGEVYII